MLGLGALLALGSAGYTQQESSRAPPADPQPEGIEVLTHGPIHEAYAELVDYRPQPGQVVPKQPPEPIAEMPPDQRPAGEPGRRRHRPRLPGRRGAEIDAYQLIDLSFGDGQAKSPLYGRLLRSMMEDQVAWIRDRNHRRVVTEVNGRDSLTTVCEADARAHRAGGDR